MQAQKRRYEPPRLLAFGSFEALTQGANAGTNFDGNFVHGQPVPLDSNGKPLIFS